MRSLSGWFNITGIIADAIARKTGPPFWGRLDAIIPKRAASFATVYVDGLRLLQDVSKPSNIDDRLFGGFP